MLLSNSIISTRHNLPIQINSLIKIIQIQKSIIFTGQHHLATKTVLNSTAKRLIDDFSVQILVRIL